MSAEEIPDEDLKQLAADLASLVPRCDGLDPNFGALLQKEALLTAELLAQQGGLPWHPCGQDARAPGRRWAWPAAFWVMTTVAAVLLVMLLMRPQPEEVAGGGVKGATGRLPASAEPIEPSHGLTSSPWHPDSLELAEQGGAEFPSHTPVASDGPTLARAERLRWRDPRLGTWVAGDAALLDRLFASAAELHVPPRSPSVALQDSQKSPPSYRELLDQLLKEQRSLQPL